MKTLLRHLPTLLVALLMLCACGKVEEEYSNKYRCRFYFNNAIHNNTRIQAACTSWGTFVHITLTGNRTVKIEVFGQNAETVQPVASEQPELWSLGIDNGSGLFIGSSSFNDGTIYAFDGQCPNCFSGGMTSYRLDFSQSGQWVTCPSCHRSYDLNNGGLVVQGDAGSKLYRYRASYGAQILQAYN